MKKLFFIVFLITCTYIFSTDIYFVPVRDQINYYSNVRSYKPLGFIYKTEKYKFDDNASFVDFSDYQTRLYYNFGSRFGNFMYVYSEDLVPYESQEIQLIKVYRKRRHKLTNTRYLRSFHYENRKIAEEFDNYLKMFIPSLDQFNLRRSDINNTHIALDFEQNFIIKNIQKENNRYYITAKMTIRGGEENNNDTTYNLSPIKNKTFFTVIMVDNIDFMTFYLENTNNFLFNIIGVDKSFEDNYRKFILQEDYSKSMINEYPNVFFTTTTQTTLYTSPDLKSPVINTLTTGVDVELLEKGEEVKTGRQRSHWMRVISTQDYKTIGWTLNSNLKPLWTQTSTIPDDPIFTHRSRINGNIYDHNDLNSPRTNRIEKGEPLAILEKGDRIIAVRDDIWVKVQSFYGTVGWINLSLIDPK